MRFILYSLLELAATLLIMGSVNIHNVICRAAAFGACLAAYEFIRDKHRGIAP